MARDSQATSKLATWLRVAGARVAGAALACALLLFAFHHGSLPSAAATPWLALAAAAYLANVLASAARWQALLAGQGLSIPYRRLVRAWLAGRFLGFFAPEVVGVDLYRIYDATQCGKAAGAAHPMARTFAAWLAEKIVAAAILTLALVATPWILAPLLRVDRQWWLALVALTGSLAAAGCVLLIHPHLASALLSCAPARRETSAAAFASALKTAGRDWRHLAIAAAWQLIAYVAAGCAAACVLAAYRRGDTPMAGAFRLGLTMGTATAVAPFIGRQGMRSLLIGALWQELPAGLSPAAFYGAIAWWPMVCLPAALGGAAFLLTRAGARARELRPFIEPAPMDAYQRLQHRSWLADALVGGAAGGLAAGALVGLAEALWLAHGMVRPPELQVLWWAPLGYGALLGAGGLALGAIALAWAAWRGRGASAAALCAWGFGGSIGASLLIIARWRYVRDVLNGLELNTTQNLAVLAAALILGSILACLMRAILVRAKMAPRTLLAASVAWCAALASAGALTAHFAAFTAPTAAVKAPTANPAARAVASPPVVLIVLDTLRADALRLYNPRARTSTPHFEAFARDGLLFTNAFAQAPWTKPSFATIFTGLYASAHGAISKPAQLADRCTTLAERLKAMGYLTLGFPNNHNILATDGFGKGFDVYDFLEPSLPFLARPSAAELALYEVLRRIHSRIPGRGIDVANFHQPGEVVNDRVFACLDGAHAPQPLFLFIHYMDPHDPYMDDDQPGVGYAMIDLGFHPDPRQFLKPMIRSYVRDVEHADQCLGAMLDGLRARALYEDALIVVTADHGEEFQEHGGWWHGEALYEEQLHVPLIVKLPNNARAGEVEDRLARLVDLLPTVLDGVGAPQDVPPALPGRSLLRPGEGEPAISLAERHYGDHVLRSARSRDAKLILARPEAPPEFYDLRLDPGETQNRAGTNDPREQTLREALATLTP